MRDTQLTTMICEFVPDDQSQQKVTPVDSYRLFFHLTISRGDMSLEHVSGPKGGVKDR